MRVQVRESALVDELRPELLHVLNLGEHAAHHTHEHIPRLRAVGLCSVIVLRRLDGVHVSVEPRVARAAVHQVQLHAVPLLQVAPYPADLAMQVVQRTPLTQTNCLLPFLRIKCKSHIASLIQWCLVLSANELITASSVSTLPDPARCPRRHYLVWSSSTRSLPCVSLELERLLAAHAPVALAAASVDNVNYV